VTVKYVVSVHGCDGSMAEAIVPHLVIPFPDEAEATLFMHTLQAHLDRLGGEWFVSADPVTPFDHLPALMPDASGSVVDPSNGNQIAVPPGKVALDVFTIANKIVDGEEFKPPSVFDKVPQFANAEEALAWLDEVGQDAGESDAPG
jgi:hypothetical protein